MPQYRGGGNPTMHVKLKLNGGELKREFFDYAMGKMDIDWPFAPEEFSRHRHFPVVECGKCGGLPWRMPTFGAEQLKRLAAQINRLKELPGHLKLKVRYFDAEEKCTGAAV